jgi:2-methylcitrate dehydratase PrpD
MERMRDRLANREPPPYKRAEFDPGGQSMVQHADDWTRQRFLQALTCVSATALLPRVVSGAQSESGDMIGRLSAYMSEAGSRALPEPVVLETKHHILDTLAAAISGSELPPGIQALKFARAYGGTGGATIIASSLLGGPIEAAIVNGALAQADETDDNYSAGGAHPGCAVVPAALATGETFGVDGTRFLRAVTLGYDIGMRAMKTILGRTVLRDMHNIVGSFGAAAAAGCIAGLDARQMRWLIDYGSQQAGGGYGAWQRDTEHMEKAFVFGAMTARNGVTAALLIASGWTGVDDVLRGHENFFQSYAPKADPGGLIDKLGESYEITQTIIKKWSTGGPIQSPLDAVVNLRKQHPFEADQVKEITVHLSTSAAPKVDNVPSPDLCIQYLIAVLLLDKTVSFRAAHDKGRMTDAAIQRQRAKVKVIAEQRLEDLLPRRVAVVEIVLDDGTKLREQNDTVRGTPDNPMSKDEIGEKARDLIVPVLGADKCNRLIETVYTLEQVRDVRTLRPLLQRG